MDSFFYQFVPTNIRDNSIGNKNAVIYTRVSSSEQLKSDSLATQLKECVSFANSNDLSVLEFFGGVSESAKSDLDRKEFQRMLTYCKVKNNRVSKIIIFSYDRFSRTGLGALELISVLKKLNIKVLSVINNVDPDSIEGQVMLTMSLTMASVQNQNKSLDTKRRMLAKLIKGVWPHSLSRGYRRNQNKLIEVSDEGGHIKKAFKLLLSGMMPFEIQRFMALQGYDISTRRWSEVFRNPFYAGVMLSRLNNYEPIAGNHVKLIGVENFKQVTKMIKYRELRGYSKTYEATESLPLKGVLQCLCGSSFTGYTNKKKLRSYYICNNQKCRVNVSASKVNDGFYEYLRSQFSVTITSGELIHELSRFLIMYDEMNQKTISELRVEINDLSLKQDRLTELVIDGTLTKIHFQEKFKELEQIKLNKQEKIEEYTIDLSNYDLLAQKVVDFYLKSPNKWREGTIGLRRRIVKMWFVGGICYDKEKHHYRTFSEHPILALLKRKANVLHKKSGLKINESALVPGAGVEPARLAATVFETVASTNSATWAIIA